MPEQPIIYTEDPVHYEWEPISPPDLSLKNSHTIKFRGETIMFATDMLRGGIITMKPRRLANDKVRWEPLHHFFPEWTMMWAPCPYVMDGKLYVLVCDTAGGGPDEYWNHMQIYWTEIDIYAGTASKLTRIDIPNPDPVGFIDPFLFRIGDWFYLCVADLWNDGTKQWWDPQCYVSANPFRGYTMQRSFNLNVPEYGIDEAPKIFRCSSGAMWMTWASGDSGTIGTSFIGRAVADEVMPEGWIKFRGIPAAELKATKSELCTALDPMAWPELVATLRRPGWTGSRDNFYLGRLV